MKKYFKCQTCGTVNIFEVVHHCDKCAQWLIESELKPFIPKTYVLTVSRVFPCTHKRKGEETGFEAKILNVLKFDSQFVSLDDSPSTKIHTIRANYELWAKRIEQIQKGNAILSIRYWSGKPYQSKQVEICQLDKDSGIGAQELLMVDHGNFTYTRINNPNEKPHLHSDCVDFEEMKSENRLILRIAKNDGLSLTDFQEWFKGYKLSNPKSMAIIHFTKFRY